MSMPRFAAFLILTVLLVPLAASSAAPDANLLNNPSLESATNNVPDCWLLGGYGTNGFVWTRTTDAHSGGYGERLDLISLVSGDRKLVSKQYNGDACWPPATAGHRYIVTAWYKSTGAPILFAYYRTSSGSWTYWTQSARFASASSWTEAQWTTPPAPSGAQYLSVGMGLAAAGSVTMDDFGLADTSDTTPPTVSLTAPANGASITGTTTLSATASDNVAVDHVDFLVDGQSVGTDTSTPYSVAWNSQSVATGAHSVSARAVDSSGNATTSSAVSVTVTNSPAPPPPGSKVYSWGFDAPHCANSVWARSPWLSPACSDPDWYAEGIYYSLPDPTSPTGTNVLTQDASGVDSTGTWQAWVHKPLTAPDGTWGSEHRVDMSVKLVRWGLLAQSICSWAGGPKIFLGRQADVYETSTYTVELAVCDGSIHIQKKSWGVNDCGKDRRAVDCGAGGTWYLLAESKPGIPSFGVWHTFSAIDRNNADGSVTLIGFLDGVQKIQYTEVPGDISLGPLRGGREGWRSNAIDWRMDSYKVTVK